MMDEQANITAGHLANADFRPPVRLTAPGWIGGMRGWVKGGMNRAATNRAIRRFCADILLGSARTVGMPADQRTCKRAFDARRNQG